MNCKKFHRVSIKGYKVKKVYILLLMLTEDVNEEVKSIAFNAEVDIQYLNLETVEAQDKLDKIPFLVHGDGKKYHGFIMQMFLSGLISQESFLRIKFEINMYC